MVTSDLYYFSQSSFDDSFPYFHEVTHQLDFPVSVAFEDVTFVFKYRYEFTLIPAIWDTICHYSGFSSATTIIASIGKSRTRSQYSGIILDSATLSFLVFGFPWP